MLTLSLAGGWGWGGELEVGQVLCFANFSTAKSDYEVILLMMKAIIDDVSILHHIPFVCTHLYIHVYTRFTSTSGVV